MTPGKMDQGRIKAAKEVLDGSFCLLHKTCRAGATTSLAAAAEELNKSFLLVAPTNTILDKTLHQACKQEPVKIAANCFCLKWQQVVKQDPFLAELPLPIENCEECEHYHECDVTLILRTKRMPGKGILLGVTYDKLAAVMLAKSKTAQAIRKKLHGLDAIVLDEAHLIGLRRPPSVPLLACPPIPQECNVLRKVMTAFQALCNESIEVASGLITEAAKGHVGKHLSRWQNINNPIPFKILAAGQRELIQLAMRREEFGISEESIIELRDICSIMGGVGCRFSYINDDDGGRVYVIGNDATLNHALREFLSSRERTVKIFTSGTLLEPRKEFFNDLAGCYLVDEIFPEAENATTQMLIIPDKWVLDSRNFAKRFDEIIARIKEICLAKAPEKCYVVAPTQKKALAIKTKLTDLPKEILPIVDYYRSVHTMGIESDLRTCIAIGIAHVPSNACDHLARGSTPEERAENSAAIRNQSVQAATWQTWCRVKDPTGERESRVYCIGVRAKQAKDAATWGPGRRMELIRKSAKRFGDSEDTSKEVLSYHFKPTVDYCLPMPRIRAEARSDKRISRARIDSMILDIIPLERVWEEMTKGSDNENILRKWKDVFKPCYNIAQHSTFSANTLIQYNRDFAHKLECCANAWHGILPGYAEDLEKLALFLAVYFCHRTDAYAIQMYDNRSEKWAFFTEEQSIDEFNLETVKKHIRAPVSGMNRRFTIGVYEIDPESDTVAWILYDFDKHKATDPDPKPEYEKLRTVLREHNIPFLLESSGSPDSYHVWVFLSPTKTFNAFCFAHVLVKIAKVDCEVWPKQKGYISKKDYGNLAKLPYAYHNKTGRRSCFLDPDTYEPLEYVPFPPIVRLFEQPEHGTAPKQQRKARAGAVPSVRAVIFRQCLKDVLASGEGLVEGCGHDLRVAIAAEARAAGLTIDEAVELFRGHVPDFDESKTRHYLEHAYKKGYKRHKCSTILNKSGKTIHEYCRKCSAPWAAENVARYDEGASA